jgi:hypothetical protein
MGYRIVGRFFFRFVYHRIQKTEMDYDKPFIAWESIASLRRKERALLEAPFGPSDGM